MTIKLFDGPKEKAYVSNPGPGGLLDLHMQLNFEYSAADYVNQV